MAARELLAYKTEQIFLTATKEWQTIHVFYWDTGTITWKKA